MVAKLLYFSPTRNQRAAVANFIHKQYMEKQKEIQSLLKRIKKQRQTRDDITADMMMLAEMYQQDQVTIYAISQGLGKDKPLSTGIVYSLLCRAQKKIFNQK